ncbi:carboxypeptidase-like regulatory domain-containing protein [Solitalea koreensis]|uniref:CarboxypepD_reg-like domain-containing protein n=1 Tax=Solitalea koreensis TaxID=543615 RepID=A0A521AYN3_9SPHI|nr:carboxypeptidase-like regulatory domain-containing protein [Solitalea koreensis]SMO39926.1 CarboxypepD_reg-like domain-containing protein [Solitalea koreensis]
MKLVLIAIFVVILSGQSAAQHMLYGDVKQVGTNEIVPYVSIEIAGQARGTLSNDHGSFEIKIYALPVQLKISCLGYAPQTISVKDTSYLLIQLQPTVIKLNEVQVYYPNYLRDLISKVHDKALKNRRHLLPGKAFYRQYNHNDTSCTEILESFYKVKTYNNGIRCWELTHSRYGIKNVDTADRVYIYNQSVVTRYLKAYSEAAIDLDIPQPICHGKKRSFSYTIANRFQDTATGDSILEIDFNSKKNPIDSTFGSFYINEKTLEILFIKGTYLDKQNVFIVASGYEKDKVKLIDNTRLDYEIRFKPDSSGLISLDYIKTKISFFTIYNKRPIRLTSEGFFFVYEHNADLKVHDMDYAVNDYENIKHSRYDPIFWFENPIIKRNPIEQRILTQFENENIIGNLLLN